MMNDNRPRPDWKFFFIVLIVTVVIGGLPYAIGRSMTPSGALFYGNKVIAPGDFSIYYSYINQGRQGRVMMYDAFTSEAHAPTLFQPLWFVVGLGARIFHLDAPTAFALARWLATPLLVFILWWTAQWLWPTERRRQRTALLLSLFASGVGGFAAVLTNSAASGQLWTYHDLWVSEAFTTLTLWSSAHFILVTSGIVFVLVAVERSWQERRWSWAMWAGLAALGVTAIHPFHVITWITAWVLLTVWRSLALRRLAWGYIARWALVLVFASPMLLLFGTQLFFDPLTVGRAAQNINETGPATLLLVGLGLLVLTAADGLWRWRPRDERWRWVVTLLAAYVIAVYLPLSFQRRLSQGLVLPFAWLSVPFVVTMFDLVRRRFAPLLYSFVGVFTVLLTFSWVLVGGLVVKDYVNELRGHWKYMYYVDAEHQALAEVLRTTDPHQPLLAPLLEGNVLAGLTAHQVFLGYGVETLDYEGKMTLTRDFYNRMSIAEQRALLRDWQLCYVLDSTRSRGYGPAFQPANWPDLKEVWAGPTTKLYQTPFCRTTTVTAER